MRIGRERYLDTSGTRGAGTLFSRDVSVKGEDDHTEVSGQERQGRDLRAEGRAARGGDRAG